MSELLSLCNDTAVAIYALFGAIPVGTTSLPHPELAVHCCPTFTRTRRGRAIQAQQSAPETVGEGGNSSAPFGVRGHSQGNGGVGKKLVQVRVEHVMQHILVIDQPRIAGKQSRMQCALFSDASQSTTYGVAAE